MTAKAPMLSLATDVSAVHVEALRVFMRGLTVQAEIGLYAHERGRRQPLIVDIEAELEPRRVHHVGDTLNYETMVAGARALADSGHIDLVETFATRLAEDLLSHPLARRIRVRVEKPEALGDAALAGVELIVTKA